MTTPIKNITEVANNQTNQYITVNEALRALESACFDIATVDFSTGNVTLSALVFDRAVFFRSSGNAVARDLTVPQSKSLFIVHNNGTAILTVKRGTASVDVAIGAAKQLYSDGTANGLIDVSGIAVAGGPPPSPVVQITGTTYDVLNSDLSKYLSFTNASAKTVTVRPNATHALQTDYELNIRNSAASNLTIVAGSGVTITPPAGGTLVVPPNGTVTLKRVALDSFHLIGLVVAI